jgi:hypothetical protein
VGRPKSEPAARSITTITTSDHLSDRIINHPVFWLDEIFTSINRISGLPPLIVLSLHPTSNSHRVTMPLGADPIPTRSRPNKWEEIGDIFRQLYVIEDKYMKDVKDIMESRHGFPSEP